MARCIAAIQKKYPLVKLIDKAPQGNQVVNIHLLGVKYALIIDDNHFYSSRYCLCIWDKPTTEISRVLSLLTTKVIVRGNRLMRPVQISENELNFDSWISKEQLRGLSGYPWYAFRSRLKMRRS
jgi:hypothetical protein